MPMSTQLKQYAAHRLRRRLLRSVPWLGGVVALVALGGAMRRKGVLGGTLDTALDMIPFVGATKNLCEVTRGRDFIRDKEIVDKKLDEESPRRRAPVAGQLL